MDKKTALDQYIEAYKASDNEKMTSIIKEYGAKFPNLEKMCEASKLLFQWEEKLKKGLADFKKALKEKDVKGALAIVKENKDVAFFPEKAQTIYATHLKLLELERREKISLARISVLLRNLND